MSPFTLSRTKPPLCTRAVVDITRDLSTFVLPLVVDRSGVVCVTRVHLSSVCVCSAVYSAGVWLFDLVWLVGSSVFM